MRKNICVLSLVIVLASCSSKVEYKATNFTVPCELVGEEVLFPLDTLTTLRMYEDSKLQDVKQGFSSIITNEAHKFDRYHNYENLNNLRTINESLGTPVVVDDDIIELIELGIELTKITKGAFNLAMGSLIDLYAPYYEKDTIEALPSEELINEALASIPSYTDIDDVIVIDKDNKTVTLNKYNNSDVIISLGGIAKGYVLDKAYFYLKEYNYPCLFDSGSSSMAMMGNNPTKDDGSYTISFRDPINQGYLLPAVKLLGTNFISTSGSYEKNFKYLDGNETKTMHHIYDSTTGKSNNYIQSISIISSSCSLAILDALTTAIFNIKEQDDILSLIDTIKETYNCDLSFMMISNNEVTMTSSFKALMQDEFNSSFSINEIKGY